MCSYCQVRLLVVWVSKQRSQQDFDIIYMLLYIKLM